MAPRIKQTLSKAHKDRIRQAALARHAERKAAGMLAPTGLPYIMPPDPPAPAPVGEPAPPAVPEPAPAAVVLPLLIPNPALTAPPAPRDAFKAWLRGREGRDASDPRMSSDPVRMGAELEDRIFAGWQAGYAAGRDSVPMAQ